MTDTCPTCGQRATEGQLARALRNKLIVSAYKGGAQLKDIAKMFDMTPARVSQILLEKGARTTRSEMFGSVYS